MATALHQSQEFLNAYAAGDKESLAKFATPEFTAVVSSRPTCRRFRFRRRNCSKSPTRPAAEGLARSGPAVGAGHRTRVTPVSGEERHHAGIECCSQGGRSLAAGAGISRDTPNFGGVPGDTIVQLYAQALIARDVPRLQSMSTRDFSERVWSRMKPDIVKVLPMPEIEPVAPVIEDIEYLGPTTQVTVTQAPDVGLCPQGQLWAGLGR